MKPIVFLFLPLLAMNVAAAVPRVSSPAIVRGPTADRAGTAAFVRVADGALVFTGQIFSNALPDDPGAQAQGALEAVAARLPLAGSDLTRIVRLNAYVTDEAAVRAVDDLMASRFGGGAVAFTMIRTPLSRPGARVALEAVATTSRQPERVEVLSAGDAVLPAGAKIFISGQAEKGDDVATAVGRTMAGLHRSLAHLGLTKADVVQVKGFIQPFGEHAAAVRAASASFDGAAAPPILFMEWVSDLHAEIEIVVSARRLPPPPESITYAWLPWLTKSPRYCNVAHVAAGTPLIFLGEIHGGEGADARTQMKTMFERLGSVLFEAGSSYRNLAKATYYLNDPTARALLGDIRGVYYDPTRPPAASALGVNGLGRPGRAAALDMIAVPVK